MGDLALQETPAVSLLSDRIANLLAEIGDVEGREGKVGPDLVKSLTTQWDTFSSALEGKSAGNINECCRQLLKFTSYTVLNMKFNLDVDQPLQLELIKAIESVETYLSEFQFLAKSCNVLRHICEDPWCSECYEQIMNFQNLTALEINTIWETEGSIILEARLQILGRPKKWKKNDVMLSLLQIFLLKGKEFFASEKDKTCDGEDLETFNPYRISMQTYVEYLEIYILFWAKFSEEIEVNVRLITDLSPELLTTVIKNLKKKASTGTGIRLLERLWKNNWSEKLFTLFAFIVPEVLGRACEIEGVHSLLSLWADSCVENAENAEQISTFKNIANLLFVKRDAIKFSDYVYSLAEIIKEKFCENDEKRQLYTLYFVRAILIDLNAIGDIQANCPQTPDDSAKLSQEYAKLSLRYLTFANFFQEFSRTAHKLRVTAFSLHPTQELFQELFPENTNAFPTNNSSELNSEENAIIPPNENFESDETIPPLTSQPPQQLAPMLDYNCADDLRLPEDVRGDFYSVLYKPRWGALDHNLKWENLKILCKKLLDQGKDFLVKTKELEFVNVDYEKYRDLPSKYDPFDDGIERGFYHPDDPPERRQRNKLVKKLIKSSFQNRDRVHPYGNYTNNTNSKPSPSSVMKSYFTSAPYIDPTEGVEMIKQYKNQFNSMTDLILGNLDQARKRKITEAYGNKFLSQKLPFPGPYNWIPHTKTYTNRKSKFIRKAPTRYETIPALPGLARHGHFEVELRLKKEKIPAAFSFKDESTNPKLSIQDVIPKATEKDWLNAEQIRNAQISSRAFLKDSKLDRKLVHTKVLLNTSIHGVPEELVKLTVEYLSLRTIAKEKSQENQENTEPLLRLNEISERSAKKKRTMFSDPMRFKREPLDGQHFPSSVKNDLAFNLGVIWETEFSQITIEPPSGPKNKQEEFRRKIMTEDALKRIKNNLKIKTYCWKEVVEKAKIEEKDIEEARRVAEESKFIPPKMPIESESQQVIKKPTKRKYEEPLSDQSFAFRLNRQSEEFVSSPTIDTLNRKQRLSREVAKLRAACASVPDPENTALGKVYDKWDMVSEYLIKNHPSPSNLESNIDLIADEFDTDPEDNSASKRGYQYYPDEVINRALIELIKGKSIKDAAEMHGIGRSALCKRLHLKGLRKNGQLTIPPALHKILMTGEWQRPDMTKPAPRYSSLLKKNKKAACFNRKHLDAAIGEVMFGNKDRNATAWKYNVPSNTLIHYITNLKKMFKGGTMSQAEVIAKIEKTGDTTDTEEATEDEMLSSNAMSMKNMYLRGVEMMQQGATVLASSLVCKLTQQDLQSFYNFASVEDSALPKPTARKGRLNKVKVAPHSEDSQPLLKSQQEPTLAIVPTPNIQESFSDPQTPISVDPEEENKTIKKPPPENYQIRMNLLQEIMKIAGKTTYVPPPPKILILDEKTGNWEYVEDLDDPEIISKEDEIISRLSPCTWLMEPLGFDESEASNDEDAFFKVCISNPIQSDQNDSASDEQSAKVSKSTGNTGIERVSLDAEHGTLKHETIITPSQEKPQSTLMVKHILKDCSVRIIRNPVAEKSAKNLLTASKPKPSTSDTKRASVRIHTQPMKLDFTTGAPVSVPVIPPCLVEGVNGKAVKRNFEESFNEKETNSKKRKIFIKDKAVPAPQKLPICEEEKEDAPAKSSRVKKTNQSNKMSNTLKSISKKGNKSRKNTPITESEAEESESAEDKDSDPDYNPDTEEVAELAGDDTFPIPKKILPQLTNQTLQTSFHNHHHPTIPTTNQSQPWNSLPITPYILQQKNNSKNIKDPLSLPEVIEISDSDEGVDETIENQLQQYPNIHLQSYERETLDNREVEARVMAEEEVFDIIPEEYGNESLIDNVPFAETDVLNLSGSTGYDEEKMQDQDPNLTFNVDEVKSALKQKKQAEPEPSIEDELEMVLFEPIVETNTAVSTRPNFRRQNSEESFVTRISSFSDDETEQISIQVEALHTLNPEFEAESRSSRSPMNFENKAKEVCKSAISPIQLPPRLPSCLEIEDELCNESPAATPQIEKSLHFMNVSPIPTEDESDAFENDNSYELQETKESEEEPTPSEVYHGTESQDQINFNVVLSPQRITPSPIQDETSKPLPILQLEDSLNEKIMVPIPDLESLQTLPAQEEYLEPLPTSPIQEEEADSLPDHDDHVPSLPEQEKSQILPPKLLLEPIPLSHEPLLPKLCSLNEQESTTPQEPETLDIEAEFADMFKEEDLEDDTKPMVRLRFDSPTDFEMHTGSLQHTLLLIPPPPSFSGRITPPPSLTGNQSQKDSLYPPILEDMTMKIERRDEDCDESSPPKLFRVDELN